MTTRLMTSTTSRMAAMNAAYQPERVLSLGFLPFEKLCLTVVNSLN